MSRPRKYSGFTLIEVAIVLLILATLAGSLLIPLSDSLERSRRQQAENEMSQEVLPALMAYAASQNDPPRLPCPDCMGNCPGADNDPGDGVEDREGDDDCVVNFGALPWATLGLASTDPWGSRYSYRVYTDYAEPDAGGIELNDNNPDLTVTRGTIGGPSYMPTVTGSNANGASAIVISHGANRYGAMTNGFDGSGDPIFVIDPPGANNDEEENADGDRTFVMRPPTDPNINDIEEFDDIVVWLSTYRLRGFLVDAGRLP